MPSGSGQNAHTDSDGRISARPNRCKHSDCVRDVHSEEDLHVDEAGTFFNSSGEIVTLDGRAGV